MLLSGENDARSAIVTIHPGAGGTESQDWAEMLLRMYLRWAERNGFKTVVTDRLEGEGAGIKSATFEINGENAYGLLQSESACTAWCASRPSTPTRGGTPPSRRSSSIPQIDDEIKIDIRPTTCASTRSAPGAPAASTST
jgi:peptide chain release factor 2